MSSWALPPRVIRSSPAVEPAEYMCGSLQLLFPSSYFPTPSNEA